MRKTTNVTSSTAHSLVKDLFHADDALSLSSLPSHLKSLLPNFANVYIDSLLQSTRRRATSLFNYLRNSAISDKNNLADIISNLSTKPIAPHIGKLRTLKSRAEQAAMHAAANISARAHTKVPELPYNCDFSHPKLTYRLDHEICETRQVWKWACGSLWILMCTQRRPTTCICSCSCFWVSSPEQRIPVCLLILLFRPNSLVLHYTRNDQIIEEGELVLIDAGCEHQ